MIWLSIVVRPSRAVHLLLALVDEHSILAFGSLPRGKTFWAGLGLRRRYSRVLILNIPPGRKLPIVGKATPCYRLYPTDRNLIFTTNLYPSPAIRMINQPVLETESRTLGDTYSSPASHPTRKGRRRIGSPAEACTPEDQPTCT